MKKKLAGIIAMMMILMMGTTVMAAPSVDKESANEEILKAEVGSVSDATATAPDGETVNITISAVNSIDIVESAKDSAADVAAMVAENATANMIGIVDVQCIIPENYISIDVTFKAAEIKKGDKVIVLHQKKDGTWEILASKIKKDGEITATFTDFSPVAIVKVEKKTAENQGTDNSGTDNSGTENPGDDTQGNNTQGSNTQGSSTQGSNTQGSNTPGTDIQGNSSQENQTTDTQVKSTETKQTQTSTGLKSPITGDLVIPVVVFVAFLCGLGIILLGRKVISR